MHRSRYVAAAPARGASDAWGVITGLIADTLDRSSEIGRSAVLGVLDSLGEVGPRLIAARHLESAPVILLAADMRLSIFSVSGADALSLEENLSAVPGAASASESDWLVVVPAPEPLVSDVGAAVQTSAFLATEEPSGGLRVAAVPAALVDPDALAARLKGGLR